MVVVGGWWREGLVARRRHHSLLLLTDYHQLASWSHHLPSIGVVENEKREKEAVATKQPEK